MPTALVIIDVQRDFCPGGALPVPDGHRVVPVINRLIPHCKLVVATQDWHPTGHISFASRHGRESFTDIELPYGRQTLWPDHCIQGTPGADFHSQLDRERIQHITRKGTDPEVDSYSAFFDNARLHRTDLDAWLKEQGARQLWIAGLATDYCVRFSALDALELGYRVTLVADGCRGIDASPGDVQQALDAILAAGGTIAASDELLAAGGKG